MIFLGVSDFFEGKSVTVTSEPLLCYPLQSLSFQASPLVRVAIQVEKQVDNSELLVGLRRMARADAGVRIEEVSSGELVICAIGEVHLAQCLKDLEMKYARVPFTTTSPLVTFRETSTLTPVTSNPNDPWHLASPPYSTTESIQYFQHGRGRCLSQNKKLAVEIEVVSTPFDLSSIIEYFTTPQELKDFLAKEESEVWASFFLDHNFDINSILR